MVVVLDTDALEPRDRENAIVTALCEISAKMRVVPTPSEASSSARLEAWQFGQAILIRSHMPSVDLARTSQHIRQAPSPLLAVAVEQHAGTRLTQSGIHHEIGAGDPWGVDLDLPYELDLRGVGIGALYITADQVSLSRETIRSGMATLRHSALAALVANHVAMMAQSAEALHADPTAPQLGDACIEMVRALFSSAAGGSEDSTALPEDILLDQVRDYVRRHLLDPDLGAAGIARAHHISVRYLYKLCANAGLRLEQWIITQRLERARNALARPDARRRSIAAVAHSHGFRDHTHFARRFRAAYGTTPSEWRQANSSMPSEPASTTQHPLE